jgi:hypothetical protein
LLHRKVGWLLALEDATDILGGKAIGLDRVNAV